MRIVLFIKILLDRKLSFLLYGSIMFIPWCYTLKAQNQTDSFEIFSSANHQNVHISNLSEWENYRWVLIQRMQEVMGPLPTFDKKFEFNLEFRDTFHAETYDRYTINYIVASREKAFAHLYIPHRLSITGKSPAILAVHPTGAAGKRLINGEGLKNRAYAKELAERGYVVLAPDFPGYGDLSDYDFIKDRYESGTIAGIFYHMRSVDLLTSFEFVDSERLGVIGHSLGGHNAMFVAAFDERLKVVVSSSGWNQFEYYDRGDKVNASYGGALGPWSQNVYMPYIKDKYDFDPDKLPFNFHEIIALIAPRGFFTNSPLNDLNFEVRGVIKGISLVQPVYDFFNAKDKLVARCPESGHDFPTEIRKEAYNFIDTILDHIPSKHDLE